LRVVSTRIPEDNVHIGIQEPEFIAFY
jgi:hypothetical protein